MTSETRARFEFLVDRGKGLDAATCIQRNSFLGSIEEEFFVNIPWPVYGFRFDPLDMEGEFRLETLQIQPVSRLYLLGRALLALLSKVRWDRRCLLGLVRASKLLFTGRLATIKSELLSNLKGHSILAPPPQDVNQAYQAWLRQKQRPCAGQAEPTMQPLAKTARPLLSVILPVSNEPEDWVRRSVLSVQQQSCPSWQLLVADHGLPTSLRARIEETAARDRRIKVSRHSDQRDRAGTTNAALASVTTNYVAFLEPGDELARHAVWRVGEAVRGAGKVLDFVYSDEDCISPTGDHRDPFFKPDWAPEYLLSWMYTGQLAVYRTSLVTALGGLRAEFAPAEAYDLILRAAAETSRVHHITDVLYHRFQWPPEVGLFQANQRVLQSYLERIGRPGSVEPGPVSSVQRVRFAIAGQPKVSIIIPTAYRQRAVSKRLTTYLMRCLMSIRALTTYPNYEVLILDNGEAPPDVLQELARWGVHRLPYARPFNWAVAMNEGAARARGAHLLFLDDDTEILTPDWLECLLEYSQQSQIGAVGARLEFPDGRLQHAGVIVLNGVPGHPFYGYPSSHPGYYFSSIVTRNYRAVTSACLMTRTEVFRGLGGFQERFAMNFNDIDYCLRVGRAGLRVVCNPYARLCHYESATKADYSLAERQAFERLWRTAEGNDPYYNPNLSARYHDFRIGELAQPA
jgi:GT2 family glycosyltransferase